MNARSSNDLRDARLRKNAGGEARILAVVPHPDDEVFFIGGTLARYSTEARIRLLFVTNGNSGKRARKGPDGRVVAIEQITDDAGRAGLVQAREAESRAAAQILGIHEVEFLRWPDGLHAAPQLLRCALRRRILAYDPHVVISLNEAGTTMHPDHSWTALAAYHAVDDAARRGAPSLEAFYTHTLPEAPTRFDYWGELNIAERDLAQIDVSAFGAKRREACLCYETQAHWVEYMEGVGLAAPSRECFVVRWSRSPHSRSAADLLAAADTADGGVSCVPIPLADVGLYTSSSGTLAREIAARAERMERDRIRGVILAGGNGSRMGNPGLPKSLEPVCGQPILHHLLTALAESDVDDTPIIVTGPGGEQIKSTFDGHEFVDQCAPLGTGHALAAARKAIEESGARHVIALCGDMPLISPETLRTIVSTHIATGSVLTLGAIRLPDFAGVREHYLQHGRIVRSGSGAVTEIVEYADACAAIRGVTEVNPSIICIDTEWLWGALAQVTPSSVKGEVYLTGLLKIASRESALVTSVEVPPSDGFGVNTRRDLAIAEMLLRGRRSANS